MRDLVWGFIYAQFLPYLPESRLTGTSGVLYLKLDAMMNL